MKTLKQNNLDTVGEIRNDEGKLTLTVDGNIKYLLLHYAKKLNKTFLGTKLYKSRSPCKMSYNSDYFEKVI